MASLLEDEELGMMPAAPEAAGMSPSNQEKLGLALIALATPALGALFGGKEGAMIGAQHGLGQAGGYLQNKAEGEAKANQAAAAREQGMADFEAKTRKKAEIENELKGDKPAKTEIRSGESDLIEYDPVTKTTKTVYKAPVKAGKDTTTADPKEVRQHLSAAGEKYQIAARPYKTALDSAKSTAQLAELAKTNPRAAGAIVGKLARAAGEVGVLSDADISRLGGSQSFEERLKRFSLLSTTDQKITDKDIQSAIELANVMSSTAQANLDDIAEQYTTRHVGIYGGDPADVKVKITGLKPSAKPAGSDKSAGDTLKSPAASETGLTPGAQFELPDGNTYQVADDGETYFLVKKKGEK